MRIYRLRRDRQCAACAFMLMAGIVAARTDRSIPYIGVGVCAVVAARIWGVRFGVCLIAALLLGLERGEATGFTHTDIGQHVLRKTAVAGTISDDPTIEASSQAAFTLRIQAINGKPAHGSVRIYTATYQELQRGYVIGAIGKVKQGKGSVPAYISYAQTTLISRHQTALERVRQRFFVAVHAGLPDPLSGFGIGLLVGARAMIDEQLQDTLNTVGLSHLIAVSGYNLTIIIQMMRRLPRLSYYASTMLSAWLIGGFLLVAGFSASIVRAAMVSSSSLLTSYYGYKIRPLTLLAVPAMITTTWNPDYVMHDVGWQLSFLAFFGILILAPALQKRVLHHPNAVAALAIESTAAQITTTPLIATIFGTVSVVAPLSNLIILPWVPLAMLLSCLIGITGQINSQLASVISYPAEGLLALMIGLIQWFAKLPHASVSTFLSVRQAIVCYAAIIGLTLILGRATTKK